MVSDLLQARRYAKDIKITDDIAVRIELYDEDTMVRGIAFKVIIKKRREEPNSFIYWLVELATAPVLILYTFQKKVFRG